MQDIAKPMHLQEERGNVIFSAVAFLPKQVIHTGKELFPQSSCNDSSDHKPLKTKKTLLIFPVGIHVNVGGIKEVSHRFEVQIKITRRLLWLSFISYLCNKVESMALHFHHPILYNQILY